MLKAEYLVIKSHRLVYSVYKETAQQIRECVTLKALEMMK